MKTITFIAITLLAGAIAGTILGAINQVAVEPYIEHAIELEMQNTAQSDQAINPAEFTAYRFWQKGGEIVAGTILGLSIGSLFGIVFAYTRRSIPGSDNKKKALFVAGIMWLVLFLIPALKYPANPPAIGDPDTIYYRQSLYVAFLAMSANPDPINAPMDLVIGFRITSAITISMFWGVLGVIFGTLWNKLNPDETARISVR